MDFLDLDLDPGFARGSECGPDFVVETLMAKHLIEETAAAPIGDEAVRAKAAAARAWCEWATQHRAADDGKQCSYALQPQRWTSDTRVRGGFSWVGGD